MPARWADRGSGADGRRERTTAAAGPLGAVVFRERMAAPHVVAAAVVAFGVVLLNATS
jgi:hypothetical protein